MTSDTSTLVLHSCIFGEASRHRVLIPLFLGRELRNRLSTFRIHFEILSAAREKLQCALCCPIFSMELSLLNGKNARNSKVLKGAIGVDTGVSGKECRGCAKNSRCENALGSVTLKP